MGCMSVDEIERAIHALSARDFAQIAERVRSLEQERWDAEIDRDASAGKLDFLISEAREDREHGRLLDWPPTE
jgi:phage FluMu protein gp41